jgi:hypothetical protein
MYKSLAGIAGAAMLFMIPAAPADAFAARQLAGAAMADQANVEEVQYRRRVYRRAYRAPYRYRYAYPRYRAYPYAYAPYPYYRSYYGPGYYGPGVGVRIGPLGFGVW